MPVEILLRNFRRNPEAALEAYVNRNLNCVVVAGNIYEFPSSGGVKRLDTWYSYPEGCLTVKVNVALIVAPQIDISWIEQGQQLQILARILKMDHMSLGCTALIVEPVDSMPPM